jgi:CheY-like chemotaxis protein
VDSSPGEPLRKLTVLVIESEPDIRRFLSVFLERDGYAGWRHLVATTDSVSFVTETPILRSWTRNFPTCPDGTFWRASVKQVTDPSYC